jgi:CPA1 family monovalent cation:H+ antiporter
MELFTLFSILITLAALFSYVNVRTFKLPSGVSLMMLGTIASLILILVGKVFPSYADTVRGHLAIIDFSEFLLGILLSFLLFAGSLHVKLSELKESAKSISVFAIVGTLLSTALAGFALFGLTKLFQVEIPLLYCLLFGALISPTDPIAVMSILSKSNLPRNIQTNIIGESLFNDGIGVVIFAVLLDILTSGISQMNSWTILGIFTQEAFGGILMGAIIGYVGYKLMKSIDHFQTEIMLSLAMVMGGYSLCHMLHVSGPLAMVVAGLITGNKSAERAMSDITRDYLEKFWEVLDEVFNALLFMLVGLELMVIEIQWEYGLMGVAAIGVVLIARYISLWGPVQIFFLQKTFRSGSLKIMTWGGLRGGISIALALSLPSSHFKEILITITFIIVLFSILVQGLTIERLIKRVTNSKKGL